MKVVRTQLDRAREIVQRYWFALRLDELAGLGDNGRVLRIERRSLGLASLARPKSRSARFCGAVVKSDVLRIGHPRVAGWTAEDAGGHHRVPKHSISAFVTRRNSHP